MAVPCVARRREPRVVPTSPRRRARMPESSTRDTTHMRRALELAALGRGLVSPNPMVGAVVVVTASGRRGLARGPRDRLTPRYVPSRRAGTGRAAPRSTAPSSPATTSVARHPVRTPCRGGDRAGRRRDRRPESGGRRPRLRRLRAAGVEVEVGDLGPARRLNAAFERHVVTGLPFVTLKMAATLDGKVGRPGPLIPVDHRRGRAHRRARPPRRRRRDRCRRRDRDRGRPVADGPRCDSGDPPLRSSWTHPAGFRRTPGSSTARRRR